MSPVAGAWLLLIVTSGKEASLRVFVWRELRKLGALYLHKSVCLLPDRPQVRTRLQPVLVRIRRHGGRARMITVSISGDEHQALIDEQRRDRDIEYGEVVERVPQFLDEIEMETARGQATYAEVEESEADLERFEKWLTAIADRDYFDAPGGDEARAAVQRCRDALAAFETAALAADTADDDRPAASGRRLTSVKEQP
jgi:Protein ChrB, N-terminal